MNDVTVVDLAEEVRAIPNPVTTFHQAFSNYRETHTHVRTHMHMYMYMYMYMYEHVYMYGHVWTCVFPPAEILGEITKAGFESPTPIQVLSTVCSVHVR